MAIYLLGIPTFLLYFSIGMLASPLSALSSHAAASSLPAGPVVQYVEVSPVAWYPIGGGSVGERGVSDDARVVSL